MNNVVTMNGAPFMDYRDLLKMIIDSDQVETVMVVVARKDGFMEIFYDRQPINQIVMKGVVAHEMALTMAAGTVKADD